MQDYISSALATLLVIADPIFLSALFLGLTHDLNKTQRAEVAMRGTVIAFFILLGAGLGGAKLLSLLGISLSAFRIAGGLLLLSSAAEMVFDRRGQRQQDIATKAVSVDHVRNIAAFPLAIPLLAGPGAITAMILLAGRADGDIAKLSALYALAGLDAGLLSCLPRCRTHFHAAWRHRPRRHQPFAGHHPGCTGRAIRH